MTQEIINKLKAHQTAIKKRVIEVTLRDQKNNDRS